MLSHVRCLQDTPLASDAAPQLQQGVINCCVAIHQSVECRSRQYLEELRRCILMLQ